MKLKNLLLATLVVCAFSACSKDDVVIQGPVEPVDASISIVATTFTHTKASLDGNGSETKNNEEFINELCAFVFKVPEGVTDETKMTLVGQGKVTSEGEQSVTTINHIVIKVTPNVKDQTMPSEDKFKVVLVANPGVSLSPTSLADLKSTPLTSSIENYPYATGTYLPMVSEVIAINGGIFPIEKAADGSTIHKENWINNNGSIVTETVNSDGSLAKPEKVVSIVLTRIVARVQVEQIQSSIHQAYDGASFELTNLSLINVRPLATMVSGIGNGEYEYVKGFQSDNYAAADRWIYPDFTDITTELENALSKTYSNVIFNNEMTTWTPKSDEIFYSYAFPNAWDSDYKTALLITGLFKRNGTDSGTIKNFRVILQDKELQDKAVQIVPNNVYKLKITLTGEGSTNEDKIELNAHISTEIVVAKWSIVNQEETDVN